MDPIRYDIDVATPFQSAIAGYQAGAGIRDDQANQLALQQKQQTAQAQQQALYALANNPNATGADYARVMTLMPGLAEPLTKAWNSLNTAQQQTHLSDLSQWGASIKAGQPQIAVDLMNARADAMEKAGGPNEKSQALRAAAGVVKEHPQFALGAMIMPQLAAHPDGSKVATTLAALGKEDRDAALAPADLAIKKADAIIKGAEADNATTKTGLDNSYRAEEIETKRSERRIAVLDTQIKQANSETQRGQLQLERDKLQAELDLKKQAASTDAQDQMDTLGQALYTVDALMKHPGLKGGLIGSGGVFSEGGIGSAGSTSGKMLSMIPGTDAKDFRAMLDTVKSQQFLSAVQKMKGQGSLSDAEGARIERAVASLDPDQSVDSLKNALGVIRSTLQKSQGKLVGSGKLPAAGGAFVMQHPEYGALKESDVNRLLQKFPGSTHDQVIQYLQSTGGK